MIRGLFFDAAGVLYTRPHFAWEEALRLLTENGIAIAKNADLEAARRHIANEASLGRISSTTYFSRAFDLYGVTGPARAAILSAVDRFADEIIPTPGARDELGELKRKRKVLGVITDTMSRARARCVGSSVAGTSANARSRRARRAARRRRQAHPPAVGRDWSRQRRRRSAGRRDQAAQRPPDDVRTGAGAMMTIDIARARLGAFLA